MADRLRSVPPARPGSLWDDADAALLLSVGRHDANALRELSKRHAAALTILACAMVVRPERAVAVVDQVFAAVWADPGCIDGQNVRAQLAALVHVRCAAPPHRDTPLRDERIALALIAFGDHTCRQAAARVGVAPEIIAARLRAFVLDPDRFAEFRPLDDNVVVLSDVRRSGI
jgi:hypothetical protein